MNRWSALATGSPERESESDPERGLTVPLLHPLGCMVHRVALPGGAGTPKPRKWVENYWNCVSADKSFGPETVGIQRFSARILVAGRNR